MKGFNVICICDNDSRLTFGKEYHVYYSTESRYEIIHGYFYKYKFITIEQLNQLNKVLRKKKLNNIF